MLWPRCTQSHEVFENVSNSAAIMHCKSELGFGKTGAQEICPHKYIKHIVIYTQCIFFTLHYDGIGKSPQIHIFIYIMFDRTEKKFLEKILLEHNDSASLLY